VEGAELELRAGKEEKWENRKGEDKNWR